MSIAIYDADMATYTLVPFNLQAMKLSAYYKRKREIVLLSKDFNTDRNSKIFYVKDWDDGNFPLNLTEDKVTYLGHAFTGNKYIPLEEEIEKMKPDTSIYSIMEKEIIGNETDYRKRIWRDMLEGEHCRFSLDGATVWKDYMKQFRDLPNTKSILIHDYDLGKIDGAWDALQEVLARTRHDGRAPNIGMKFPMTITNSEELLKWSSIKVHPIFYSIRFNGVIDEDIFWKWAAAGYKKDAYALLEYNITSETFNENDFVKNQIRQIFRQIIISRSYRLKISLIYNKDLFIHKEWARILELFNYYQHSMHRYFSEDAFIREVQTDTLYDFIKNLYNKKYTYGNIPDKAEMRKLFHFVGEQCPDLFKDFYELNYLKLKETRND